ncbi:hypothetical protein P152DRAFT_456355 [Eremomyces bilateralis CBS 781.70]|uniref:Calcium channel YVC1-like C-terminal transmembrane domain-containing protein n=1 Tax=Eremomyces bilateralis CBS 781.70 TaxID=1392243 RepID=A0A6G1G8E6_9PEZI|nr:uncharacterized protein P152DRAFT_456355 [Eremomyces bilateralis CBS 781.70]KAF1814129.1 hypothetical protein P152DRAFT_456355 [Eremomyces bilateralis CBS 781.70]
MNQDEASVTYGAWLEADPSIPIIDDAEPLSDVISKLSIYIVGAIKSPYTFEELRRPQHSQSLAPLIEYLGDRVHHRWIVLALLQLKGHFAALEPDDDRGINDARGFACELVAWRFVLGLSRQEALDYLLSEYTPHDPVPAELGDEESGIPNGLSRHTSELDPLLASSSTLPVRQAQSRTASYFGQVQDSLHDADADSNHVYDLVSSCVNLNALEVAAVSEAKKFLSQKIVQQMIERIWRGDIIFWETLSVDSVKRAKLYNPKRADAYCRLRVPRYLKTFEVLFFVTFLFLYYVVLVQRDYDQITVAEILLYVFIAGFAYDEFGEYRDAGQAFYATDFWSLWDLCIALVGFSFLISRAIGIARESDIIIDTSFDILALEALFLVPRTCSVLSLNPYFGTLMPCLKEMTKDFAKFLSIVTILYIGFLTTFTLLARDNFTLSEMSWILIKVFFGSSYLGFDVAAQISPILGPPVMLIFICLTNILLITSLISLLSNSLTKVLDHAKEEYLFIYSVYVLEASTSNRLTYYLPPWNLISLVSRPLRLFLPSDQLRRTRIAILKVTHTPYVAAIWAYESLTEGLGWSKRDRTSWMSSNIAGPGLIQPLKRQTWKISAGTPRALVASMQPTASDGRGENGRASTADYGSHSGADNADEPQDVDLKSLVLKLSTQVEQLMAIVTERQGGNLQDDE